MTLWPPGAWPPDKTTPIFKLWVGCTVSESLGTSVADGCPKRFGNSFAISSAKRRKLKIEMKQQEWLILLWRKSERGDRPGLPAEELWGPSTILKGLFRTEGRGRAWSIRLFWTSLYKAANLPVAEGGVTLPSAKLPFVAKDGAIFSRERVKYPSIQMINWSLQILFLALIQTFDKKTNYETDEKALLASYTKKKVLNSKLIIL